MDIQFHLSNMYKYELQNDFCQNGKLLTMDEKVFYNKFYETFDPYRNTEAQSALLLAYIL